MSSGWEVRIERNPKTRKQRVSVGTWGAMEGQHLIYPTESQLVEFAMTLLNAAWAMKQDRQGKKRKKKR